MNFINIVSLLDREHALDKFKTLVATTTLVNIADAISQALEHVINFKPQLEVMRSLDGKILFREDWTYYTNTEGAVLPFNPFNPETELVPGDVYCMERPTLVYSAVHLNNAYRAGNFDYGYMPNPALFQLVADALNVILNEDQLWTRVFRQPRAHFLQDYIGLERLVQFSLPELADDLRELQQDIGSEQQSFRHLVAGGRMTREQAMHIYEVSGTKYENEITQDFWDRQPVRVILRELSVSIERIITSLFPTVRGLAERSVHPAHGYDVFFCDVIADNQLAVKNLGDFRILHWELNQ